MSEDSGAGDFGDCKIRAGPLVETRIPKYSWRNRTKMTLGWTGRIGLTGTVEIPKQTCHPSGVRLGRVTLSSTNISPLTGWKKQHGESGVKGNGRGKWSGGSSRWSSDKASTCQRKRNQRTIVRMDPDFHVEKPSICSGVYPWFILNSYFLF